MLTDSNAVKDELLTAHADEFSAALEQLEGRAQYVVKGRYVEQVILSEVLEENGQARELREALRDQPEETSRDARMALGEIISNAIVAKRDEDTAKVVEALTPLADFLNVREPTHELEAAHVAVLVEVARRGASSKPRWVSWRSSGTAESRCGCSAPSLPTTSWWPSNRRDEAMGVLSFIVTLPLAPVRG